MLKVFLVEDEIVMREGIKKNIDWEKEGFSSLITTQGTLSSWWVRIVLSALLCFFIVLQAVIAAISRKKIAQHR